MTPNISNTPHIVERLKACAHCGSEPIIIAGIIGCPECASGQPNAERWNLRTPDPVITAYEAALVKCRDKFRHYEQLHRLKCTPEGDEKADRNREMADMIDAALAAQGTAP